MKTRHKKYKGKKLCSECKSYYHPVQFKVCWDCHSTQPARITQFDKRLKDAKSYVNYNIGEGIFDESDWQDLSDEEFLKKAEAEQDRGDFYANS